MWSGLKRFWVTRQARRPGAATPAATPVRQLEVANAAPCTVDTRQTSAGLDGDFLTSLGISAVSGRVRLVGRRRCGQLHGKRLGHGLIQQCANRLRFERLTPPSTDPKPNNKESQFMSSTIERNLGWLHKTTNALAGPASRPTGSSSAWRTPGSAGSRIAMARA